MNASNNLAERNLVQEVIDATFIEVQQDEKTIKEKESELLSLIILNSDNAENDIPIEHINIQSSSAIEITSTKEEEIASTIEEEITSTIEEEITSTIEEEITSTIEEEITSTIEEEFTSTIEQEITSTIEEETTSTIEEEITSTIEQEITSTIGEEITSTIGEEFTENINNEVTTINTMGEVITEANQDVTSSENKHYSDIQFVNYVTQIEVKDTDIADANDSLDEDNVTTEELLESSSVNQFVPEVEKDGNSISLNIHAADAAWIALLDKFEYIAREDRIRGYVDGEKSFLQFWETFQTSTMSSFTVRSSDKFYSKATPGDEKAINGKILKGKAQWKRKPLVPFDGIPFVQIERKYSGCRLGGHERFNKNKGSCNSTRHGQSIKVGCTAEAEVLEVWRVPELSLRKLTCKTNRLKSNLKKKLLSKVHEHIALNKFHRRYYIMFPLISKHQNHSVLDQNAGKLKLLHPKIIELIYEYVNQGILERKVIRCMLEEFVHDYEKDLNVKIRSYDRSFYPTDRDIGNHVRNALNFAKSTREKSQEKVLLNIEGQNYEIESETALNVQNENCFQQGTVIENQVDMNDVSVLNTFANGVTDLHTCSDDVVTDLNTCSNSLLESYREIITTNYGFGVSDDQSHIDFETSQNSQNIHINIIDPDFNEPILHNNTDQFLNHPVQTVSMHDIVPNNITSYYQNNLQENPATLLDEQIRLLLDPCSKRNDRKRKSQAKSHFQDRELHETKYIKKDTDIKSLLKDEIQKSLLVISEGLHKVDDENKLKLFLKKVKSMQTVVNQDGQQAIIKRERKTGMQAMINIDNVLP